MTMTEQEAIIFIQNAMEQSRKALAELMLLNPQLFKEKSKILGEYYSNLENCKKEMESCKVAIKALEEVRQYREIGNVEEIKANMEELKRWHTDKTNPKIKNVFANTSTLICHNCDHKDDYIEDLQDYIDYKNDYTEDLEDYIEKLGAEIDEYRTIGTVEECRAAVEKQIAKKDSLAGKGDNKMAANKLTIDLSDSNKEILEKIKTERRIPYGNTINSLIDTFCEIPESVKKELLTFIKTRIKALYKEMDVAEDFLFRDLAMQSQAYIDIATFLNDGRRIFIENIEEKENDIVAAAHKALLLIANDSKTEEEVFLKYGTLVRKLVEYLEETVKRGEAMDGRHE